MKVISSGMFITILVAMVSGFIGFLVGSSTNINFQNSTAKPASHATLEEIQQPPPRSEIDPAKYKELTEPTDISKMLVLGRKAYENCVGCHGVTGEGGVGPRLNSQSAEAIFAKLKIYKAGERVGPLTSMMAPIVTTMSEEEMHSIALYITSDK